MNKRLLIIFILLYSVFGGIALGSAIKLFFIYFLPSPMIKYPLLQPFAKLTFWTSFTMGLSTFIIQLYMVIKKRILVRILLFSIVLGIVGCIFISLIWMQGIEFVSDIKKTYQTINSSMETDNENEYKITVNGIKVRNGGTAVLKQKSESDLVELNITVDFPQLAYEKDAFEMSCDSDWVMWEGMRPCGNLRSIHVNTGVSKINEADFTISKVADEKGENILDEPIRFKVQLINKNSQEVKENNKPQKIKNLKQIDIENLNDYNNLPVRLDLPCEWFATGYFYKKDESFEFNLEKNKNINKIWSYKIYTANQNEIMNLWYTGRDKGLIGEINTLGYYRSQPETIKFPNHSIIKYKAFSGETVLGSGKIFILEYDIDDVLKRKEHQTFEMIYAWIPIESEDLAYNLTINVPIDCDVEVYLEKAKSILQVR